VLSKLIKILKNIQWGRTVSKGFFMSFKCYCKLRFESFATAVFCDFEEKRGLNFSWYSTAASVDPNSESGALHTVEVPYLTFAYHICVVNAKKGTVSQNRFQ
jgi:hypothetical protein